MPRSRSHVVTFPAGSDRACRNRRGRRSISPDRHSPRSSPQGRVVTRVAVTVRTKTFFTRTKIRKLPSGGQRRRPDHDDGAAAARPVRTRPSRPAARRAAGARAAAGRLLSQTRAIPSAHAAHDRHPRIPLAARDRAATASPHRRHRRQRHRQVVAVPGAATAGRLRARRGDRVAGSRGRTASRCCGPVPSSSAGHAGPGGSRAPPAPDPSHSNSVSPQTISAIWSTSDCLRWPATIRCSRSTPRSSARWCSPAR